MYRVLMLIFEIIQHLGAVGIQGLQTPRHLGLSANDKKLSPLNIKGSTLKYLDLK
jgi:hypothetical protein